MLYAVLTGADPKIYCTHIPVSTPNMVTKKLPINFQFIPQLSALTDNQEYRIRINPEITKELLNYK